MAALDWYGIVGSALIFLAFSSLRNVSTYIKACSSIVLASLVVLGCSAQESDAVEALVWILGIGLLAVGLLFVRVMFVRSVSLSMLRSIENGSAGAFGEDIGGRLGDMRHFRLISTKVEARGSAREQHNELIELTAFGRAVSTLVAICYALLRVKA